LFLHAIFSFVVRHIDSATKRTSINLATPLLFFLFHHGHLTYKSEMNLFGNSWQQEPFRQMLVERKHIDKAPKHIQDKMSSCKIM